MIYLPYEPTKYPSSPPFCDLSLVTSLERTCFMECCQTESKELVCGDSGIKYSGYFGDCLPFLLFQTKNDLQEASILEITFFKKETYPDKANKSKNSTYQA